MCNKLVLHSSAPMWQDAIRKRRQFFRCHGARRGFYFCTFRQEVNHVARHRRGVQVGTDRRVRRHRVLHRAWAGMGLDTPRRSVKAIPGPLSPLTAPSHVENRTVPNCDRRAIACPQSPSRLIRFTTQSGQPDYGPGGIRTRTSQLDRLLCCHYTTGPRPAMIRGLRRFAVRHITFQSERAR